MGTSVLDKYPSALFPRAMKGVIINVAEKAFAKLHIIKSLSLVLNCNIQVVTNYAVD